MVGQPPIRVAIFLILCVAGVDPFQYSVRVVRSIRSNLVETLTLTEISSLNSKVCDGDHNNRWLRCEEAVKVLHCHYSEKTTLDRSRRVGGVKIFTVKEKGSAEDSIIACECPATPNSIYLTDNNDLPGDQVHVIFVKPGNFTKRVLWKSPRKVVGKIKKAIEGKNRSDSVEGPVPNTGHEHNTSVDDKQGNLEDRVGARNRSARGDRSESGSVVGNRSERRSAVPTKREKSVKDRQHSPDRLSVTSRTSARNRPVNKAEKRGSTSNERQSDESLKKMSGGDLSQPDPSESASIFEGPASVNDEVYKDIQGRERTESLLDEDSKQESIPPSTTRENARLKSVRAPSVQSERSSRREAASAAHRDKPISYNRRTSRSGSIPSVQGEPVAGSLGHTVIPSVSDRRQSKKESLQQKSPEDLEIPDDTPSGERTREQVERTRAPGETSIDRSEDKRPIRGSTDDQSLSGSIRQRALPGNSPSTRGHSVSNESHHAIPDQESNRSQNRSMSRTVQERTTLGSPEHDSSSRRKARNRRSVRRGALVQMTDEGNGSRRSTDEINDGRRLQRDSSVSARGSRTFSIEDRDENDRSRKNKSSSSGRRQKLIVGGGRDAGLE